MKKTQLISGFPGIGKTYASKNYDGKLLDLDIPREDWNGTISTYIEAITDALKKDYDVILVTSHSELRTALNRVKMDYHIVYPDKKLKDEYKERYKERGSNDKLVDVIMTNWDEWIDDIEDDDTNNKVIKHKLGSGQFLSDALDIIDGK